MRVIGSGRFEKGRNEMSKRKAAQAERRRFMVRMCAGMASRTATHVVPFKVKGPKARAAKAVGSYALGSFALGALATGAIAVGTLAVGRVAVGRLTLREGRIKRLRIDELEVGRFHLAQQELQAATSPNGDETDVEREPARMS
jgi:hypothetical protein